MVGVSDSFHAVKREALSIDREILEIGHVVDIAPNRLERDRVLLVLDYHLLQLVDCLVSPSALVVAQRPKWRNRRTTHILMKFSKGLLGAIAA